MPTLARIALHAEGVATESSSQGKPLVSLVGFSSGHEGGEHGVCPGDGEIRVTLRADTADQVEQMREEIVSFAVAEAERQTSGSHAPIASGSGPQDGKLHVTTEVVEPFIESRNTLRYTETAAACAADVGLTVVPMDTPFSWSEDCGVLINAFGGGAFCGIGKGHGSYAIYI